MKKYELTSGIVVGLLTILIFFIVHQIEPKWMLNPLLYWGSLLLYLLGMLGATLLEKRQNQGVLSFRAALRSGFLTFLVANVIFFAFYYYMFAVYNTDLPNLQKEIYQSYYEQRFSANELRKHLQQLEESDFSVTLQSLPVGFAYGAIGGFFMALIIALLVKQGD